LSDKRFIKLSRDYERERDGLKTAIETTRRDLEAQERGRANVKSFIAATKKYADLKELDATVLREFIEKVYVSEKNKETGHGKSKSFIALSARLILRRQNNRRKIPTTRRNRALRNFYRFVK
jgi:isocitrate/isopropylmalate dehydrogenase